jgi:spermidine synthase
MSFIVNIRWGILAFFSGVAALIYQTLWVKQLSLVVGVDVYAVTTGVAAFFAGLALGSFGFSRISDRAAKPTLLFAGLEGGIQDPEQSFGLLIAAAGICSLLLFALLGNWLDQWQYAGAEILYNVTDNRLALVCARFTVAALVLILPPTLFLGAAFPAAVRLIARSRQIGADFGMVAAWNTAGGVGGTLITGFFLVPALGLIRTLSLLALAAVLIGAAAVVVRSATVRSYGVAAGLVLVVIPPPLYSGGFQLR